MKVIITGSTGMVGKGALIECLESKEVKQVLVINRNPLEMKHPKLRELIHKDFSDFSAVEDQLQGYDACFHCMGVSAAGMSEERYTHITYNMTRALSETLYKLNPEMVFQYVSGMGTDSSEKGRLMWARVKGKTENMVLKLGFKDAYALRPGAILPEKGVRSRTSLYNFFYFILWPFFPLMRRSKSVITTPNLGKAMIALVTQPQEVKILENPKLNIIAKNDNPVSR